MKRAVSHALLALALVLALPAAARASQYICSIKSVLGLNDEGMFVTHGWENFYLNREFTVDRETGRVISTTALKARLKNFDKSHQPILVSDGKEVPYKSVTLFKDAGEFTVLQIDANVDGKDKPFYYQTAVGMLLTGTCKSD